MLELGPLRVLLDCGMFQGSRAESRRLNEWLPPGAARADAVILTHGHLDHCGKLPLLVRHGFAGPVYCTPATFDVARIVLEDAAEIQEEDAQYLNQRSRDPGQPQVQPLYTRADAHDVFKQFQRTRYGERTEIRKDGASIQFTFHDAGHIIGSAYVIIEYADEDERRTLLFTGDVGRYGTPIIRDPQPLPHPVDRVITESTYGEKRHAPMSEVEPQLLDAVKACIARGGRLLLPAFAVGRTQVILYYLQHFVHAKQIPQIPIFIDSPMGVEVTEAHQQHREYYDHETNRLIGENDLFGMARVTFAVSAQQSREINAMRGPCVIIASSPTCEFGRILHHLRHSVENERDMVVFTGWIPHGTLGRRLQRGEKRVRIYDRWYDVRCETRTIHGLSAHADADELLRFLKPTLHERTTAYVVHGEPEQSEGFARRLLESGMGSVIVPALETSVIDSPSGARPKPPDPRNRRDVVTDGD
jgi:metallo-beta-lactamase family protein